jgi:FemAB-related protein (PEP-CTERM system-associated)
MNAAVFRSRLKICEINLADPNECARIDAWVCERADGSPFHLTAWQKAIADGCEQQAFFLVAESGLGEIMGILPLHLVHSPLFGRAMVSSGFAVGGGILAESRNASDKLFAAAWALAEKWSCPTLELRGGVLPSARNGMGWTIKRDAHANFLRPLAIDDDAELLSIPRKQRAEVRKGLENNLSVQVGNGARDIEWHYNVYSESVRNLGTPVFPAALMQQVIAYFGANADILTVLQGDVPVASVLSLYHNGVVMPYWGGGIWEARKLRANDLMYYALMNHARSRGCTHFDFGRSKVDSGAYSFKKNWGFEPEPMSYAVRTADGCAPRDVNPNSPKYRAQIALWQKLPLSIANRFGPWIAKGIG